MSHCRSPPLNGGPLPPSRICASGAYVPSTIEPVCLGINFPYINISGLIITMNRCRVKVRVIGHTYVSTAALEHRCKGMIAAFRIRDGHAMSTHRPVYSDPGHSTPSGHLGEPGLPQELELNSGTSCAEGTIPMPQLTTGSLGADMAIEVGLLMGRGAQMLPRVLLSDSAIA